MHVYPIWRYKAIIFSAHQNKVNMKLRHLWNANVIGVNSVIISNITALPLTVPMIGNNNYQYGTYWGVIWSWIIILVNLLHAQKYIYFWHVWANSVHHCVWSRTSHLLHCDKPYLVMLQFVFINTYDNGRAHVVA